MALLRNMVTAVSEALEWQRAILDVVGIARISLPQAAGGWRSMQQSASTSQARPFCITSLAMADQSIDEAVIVLPLFPHR
jgi:hypothetical protein